ncbi:Flagellar protein FliS OS=Stutzerimonas stutzeri OX=316 GN=CXK95_10375 PE=3 SV=1 [Stutzerimonas stutzeri]
MTDKQACEIDAARGLIQMNAMAAMRQYQQVGVKAQVTEADPHRLIQMLMQGGLDRIAQARGAMEREAFAEKGVLIGKAINIIGGLRDVLDKEAGGELATNLERLYEYMTMRLFEASRHNDVSKLDEVAKLLGEIKSGWDGIA